MQHLRVLPVRALSLGRGAAVPATPQGALAGHCGGTWLGLGWEEVLELLFSYELLVPCEELLEAEPFLEMMASPLVMPPVPSCSGRVPLLSSRGWLGPCH